MEVGMAGAGRLAVGRPNLIRRGASPDAQQGVVVDNGGHRHAALPAGHSEWSLSSHTPGSGRRSSATLLATSSRLIYCCPHAETRDRAKAGGRAGMDVAIKVERGSLTSVRTPLLVVNLFEGVEEPGGATGAVDEALGGLISRLISDGEITGALGEVTVLHNQGDRARLAADRVAVVGLGKRDDFDLEAVRIASATATRKARDLRVGRFATIVHGAGTGGLDARLAARTAIEASLLSLYTYNHYKTPPEDPSPTIVEIVVVERDEDRADAVQSIAAEAAALVDAVNLARDLSQAPGNAMTPTILADRAREMAEQRGIAIQVWGKEELREKRMNAILAVNSGSAQEPRFVVMRYDSGVAGAKTLAVVGKGITFDSGGISLKPGDHMENMKHDMSGAAATVGFLQAAADLKLPCNVIGIFAATENLPSGTAYKPGTSSR